jgi:hypothetical protein
LRSDDVVMEKDAAVERRQLNNEDVRSSRDFVDVGD